MMDQLFGSAEVTSVLLERAENDQDSLCLSVPRLSWALIELISCLIGPLRPSSEFSGSVGAFLNRLTTQIVKGGQICQVGRIIASTGYFGGKKRQTKAAVFSSRWSVSTSPNHRRAPVNAWNKKSCYSGLLVEQLVRAQMRPWLNQQTYCLA